MTVNGYAAVDEQDTLYEAQASIFVSTNNLEMRLQPVGDARWKALHFSMSPDVSYGTGGFYTADMDAWSG